MNVDHYTAVIDTAILILLIGWMIMDRCNFYFKKDK